MEMIFMLSSKLFLVFWALISSISPHVNDKSDITKSIVLTISVGILGTNPVCKYSQNTGANKPSPNTAKS